uniref:Cell division protein FtsL n=1 Tax=Thermodesulfobacterium geofontis TaxID=1295609 RepID=A0A7V5XFX8_9BACT
MNNKTIIYRPTIEYNYKNKKDKSKDEAISFKDWIKEFITDSFIFFLGILIFVLSVAIAYNTYLLIKLKVEKVSLLKENQILKKEHQFLTSKKVVLEKAKTLGLSPPQKEDMFRLE